MKHGPKAIVLGLLLGAAAGTLLGNANGADLPLRKKAPTGHSRAHLVPRVVPKLPAGITCAQVRWVVENVPDDKIEDYKAMLTPGQLDAAERCLKEKDI